MTNRLDSELQTYFAQVDAEPIPTNLEDRAMSAPFTQRSRRSWRAWLAGGTFLGLAAATAVTVVALTQHSPVGTLTPASSPTPPITQITHSVKLETGACCAFNVPLDWTGIGSGSDSSGAAMVSYTVSGPRNMQVGLWSYPADATCGTTNPNGNGTTFGIIYPSPDTFGALASAEAAPGPRVISSRLVTIAGQQATLYVVDTSAAQAAPLPPWAEIVSFKVGTTCEVIIGTSGQQASTTTSATLAPGESSPPPLPAVATDTADESTVEHALLSASLSTHG